MSKPTPTEVSMPTSADTWRCALCHAVMVWDEPHACPAELRIREIVREEMSLAGRVMYGSGSEG